MVFTVFTVSELSLLGFQSMGQRTPRDHCTNSAVISHVCRTEGLRTVSSDGLEGLEEAESFQYAAADSEVVERDLWHVIITACLLHFPA